MSDTPAVQEIKLGQKFYDEHGVLKVVGFVEKLYVAVRRPHAMPFLVSRTDLFIRFKPVEAKS